MDNKKFEQLIDLIINENEEQAKALFHDIVVEKSREIYESLMDEQAMEEGDQVGDFQDEIRGDEQGMHEEEDEFADLDAEDEEGADSFGDEGEMGGEGDLEDRVVDLEDKLDELMAEFEEIMGGDDMGGEEFGSEEGGEEFGGDEEFGGEMMESDDEEEESLEESDDEEEEESLEESVQLKKVPGLYDSKIGGDDGQNTKSIALTKPKVVATGAKPTALGSQEAGKGGTQGGLLNPSPKTIPGKYKNAPGSSFSEKGEAAPKPKHGDNGQNTKSIVGESRKTVKKIIKK